MDVMSGSGTWESVAMIGAAALLLSAVGVLVKTLAASNAKLIREVRKESDKIRTHTELQVIRANGVPSQIVENIRIPVWYKDTNLVMRYLNPAYGAVFGVTAHQYVGRTDRDVWGSAIADAFEQNDMRVLREKVQIEFKELVPASISGGGAKFWYVVKFPVYDAEGILKGVGGYSLHSDMFARLKDDEATVIALDPVPEDSKSEIRDVLDE